MKTTYHELNPLIRGRELDLLSNETIEQLIQAKSVDDAGRILETTVYNPYIYDGFAEEFEKNLSKGQAELFDWIKERAPEPDVLWVYTMRLTFHNLKVLTKAEQIGKNLDHLFLYDGFFSKEVIKQAIRTGESSELPAGVLESIQEVCSYLEESTILQGIDVIYDRHFLTEQRRLGEQLGYPELLEEITAFIDLTNLITTARGILQKRSEGFMTTVLSSSGNIPKQTFLDFAESEMAPFVQFLKASDYEDALASVLGEDTIDLVKLERLKDDYLTGLYQTAQTQAFGPLPLLAFLNAKEIETKNLRLIIVGKRSHFSNEVIRERVRKNYDS